MRHSLCLAIVFFLVAGCTTTPTEIPTPHPTPLTGSWVIETGKSEFDDSKTVTIYQDADKPIKDLLGDDTLPRLYIRCKEGKLETYINTGTPPGEFGLDGWVWARVRYDQDEAEDSLLKPSSDLRTLFFQYRAKETIMTMLEHETLLFGFTPFNTDPTSFSFDLTGLPEAIKPVLEVCPYIP